MRLDTAFVKHADTTYCGTGLGQSQDIANWSKKERFTPRLPHRGSSGACEQKYMRERSGSDGRIGNSSESPCRRK